MAVDYGEDDVDALGFGRGGTFESVDVVSLKGGKEQSKYFEMGFRACSRTRESAQA